MKKLVGAVRSVMCGAIVLLGCLSALAQTGGATPDPRASQESDGLGLLGCLSGTRGEFQFSDSDGNLYRLTGRTSGLEKYYGEEMRVEGKTDTSTQPFATIDVTSFKEVFRAPAPKLSALFSDVSNWQAQTNREFGISFSLPRLANSNAVSAVPAESNFAAEQGTIRIAELDIPSEIYANTNFVGGSYAIFVNPKVTNAESCRQFGAFNPRLLASRTMGGIIYTELTDGDASAGTSYGDYYFNTFQNNLCYELSFALGEYNTGNQDLGCTVPVVTEANFLKIIDALAGRVSFLHSANEVTELGSTNSVPKVISFTASPETADNVTNRGVITFSWSTENTDYVALSYHCSVVTRLPIVILEEGGAGSCENSHDSATNNTTRFHRSPNSSTDVTFGNMHSDDPIAVVVTITPFFHGQPYLESSKSVTVMVQPWNPFPQGVPTETRNMAILYPAKSDGTSKFEQGSSLKLEWTDSLTRDPCVNLYLVQDNSGGHIAFRFQIVKQCLTPAQRGSFTWTIPNTYAGSGFRIYGAAPGGTSATFGAPFNIVKGQPRER